MRNDSSSGGIGFTGLSTPPNFREELDSAERDAAREDAAWDAYVQLDDEERAAWERRHGRGWR